MCGTAYFSQVQEWFVSMLTTKNFFILLFVLIVLAVLKSVLGTMKDLFGGGSGGGGGRVTVVT
jgi:hypothetical protein